jgi:hypothetical protein
MTDSKKPAPNAAQLASPSFRLAALDRDFLLDDSMRGVRFHLEYQKAEQALRAWGVNSTIVVFGSARITENGKGEHARWYAMAREFAQIASRRGGAMDPDHNGRRENVIAAAAASWRRPIEGPSMSARLRSASTSAFPSSRSRTPTPRRT